MKLKYNRFKLASLIELYICSLTVSTNFDCQVAQSVLNQFSHFTIWCVTSDWLRRGQNSQCIVGKCQKTNVAQYKITREHVSNDLKMWINDFTLKYTNTIIIHIHNRSIYFKIITYIILGLVISNVFACKTNSVLSDFVYYCVTGKHNSTRGTRFEKRRNCKEWMKTYCTTPKPPWDSKST